MEQEELDLIMAQHQEWLKDNTKGKRANLCYANLSNAYLRNADLRGADLDYSSGLPMCCRGLHVQIDDRIAIQLMYHCLNNVIHSNNVTSGLKSALLNTTNVEIANRFHCIEECEEIEVFGGGEI